MGNRRASNPYNSTVPVEDPDMFFGRDHALAEIVDERIYRSQPISTVVLGGRKIGKTSLLYAIRRRLTEASAGRETVYVPVYLALDRVSMLTAASLLQHVLSAVATSLRQHWGLPIERPQLVGTEPYTEFVEQLVIAVEQCCEHFRSLGLVILIDEAERLLGHDWSNDILGNLRDLVSASELRAFVTLVLAGFRELHDAAVVEQSGVGSPLGNAARWTHLGVLDDQAFRRLVTVPMCGRVPEHVVSCVREQSGRHPFVTQYLMERMWGLESAEMSCSAVAAACASFEDEVKVFRSWQDRFTALDAEVYRALASSKEALVAGAIPSSVNCQTSVGAVEDSLAFLTYSGVVSEESGTYSPAGQLFRQWFLKRQRDEPASGGRLEETRGFDIRRVVVSSMVSVALFAATLVALVWAAQRIPPVALSLVLVVAVVVDLVLIVTILVMNGILRQKWAIDFYQAVLAKIPLLSIGTKREPEAQVPPAVDASDEVPPSAS